MIKSRSGLGTKLHEIHWKHTSHDQREGLPAEHILHLSMLRPTSLPQSEVGIGVGIGVGIWLVTLTPPMGHLIFPYTLYSMVFVFHYGIPDAIWLKNCVKRGQISTLMPHPPLVGIRVEHNIDRCITESCTSVSLFCTFNTAARRSEMFWLKKVLQVSGYVLTLTEQLLFSATRLAESLQPDSAVSPHIYDMIVT